MTFQTSRTQKNLSPLYFSQEATGGYPNAKLTAPPEEKRSIFPQIQQLLNQIQFHRLSVETGMFHLLLENFLVKKNRRKDDKYQSKK